MTSRKANLKDTVFDAIRYYRYRGINLKDIDQYSMIRVESKDYNSKRNEALLELEKELYIEKRGKLWYLNPSVFKLTTGDSYLPEFNELDFCILMAILGHGDNCNLSTLIRYVDFIAQTQDGLYVIDTIPKFLKHDDFQKMLKKAGAKSKMLSKKDEK